MQLVRLIYFSTPKSTLSAEAVLEIFTQARLDNLDQGITGALIVSSRYFIQVLEGGRSAVSNLLLKIWNDHRHSNLTIVSFDEITLRLFAAWSMNVCSIKDGDILEHAFKYITRVDSFDPSVMRPSAILSLVQDLVKLDRPFLIPRG